MKNIKIKELGIRHKYSLLDIKRPIINNDVRRSIVNLYGGLSIP